MNKPKPIGKHQNESIKTTLNDKNPTTKKIKIEKPPKNLMTRNIKKEKLQPKISPKYPKGAA